MKNFFKSFLVISVIAVVIATSLFVKETSAFFGDVPTSFVQNGVTVNVDGVSENLTDNGTYSATYKYTSPNHQDVSFVVEAETDKCSEPAGGDIGSPRGSCSNNRVLTYPTISLNASNDWTQHITLSVTQTNNMPCGSFQTDLRHNFADHYAYATSLYHTGKDLNNPSQCFNPSPSPLPSPSSAPQSQEQNQEQTQNNSQNQTNNQNANATGGNSSSSSSSNSSVNLTINNPTPAPTTTTVVYKQTTPQVVTQVKGAVTELPKTGLPLAALALGGLLPAGFGLKRFGKKSEEFSANSIWTERELNS